MSTTVPLRYNDPSFLQRTGNGGRDVLGASGMEIRPVLGVQGGRRLTIRHLKRQRAVHTQRTHRKQRKQGGFIPTVMEPFVTSVSKYIVPLVLYSGYKLMTRNKTSKKGKKKYQKR